MHKQQYIIDGRRHTIWSSNLLPKIVISDKQNEICRQLKRLLIAWIELADELDIKWFCNGGTLLGTIRDEGLIHYDNDIDVVVQYKDHKKLLNYKPDHSLLLTESESGFKLSHRKNQFPFIDIWIVGPDKHDNSRVCICGPIIDSIPLYYFTGIWTNEWYYKTDIRHLEMALFEGIPVFVPRNSETILRRMYGPICLTEYRVECHTEAHELFANFIDASRRMKIARLVKRVNTLFHLDTTRETAGHLSCLVAKTTAELTASSAKDKAARIQKHVIDYLRENMLSVVDRR